MKIVIIGMGNIGKRHLQAVSNLSLDVDVFCYDKVKNAMESIPVLCKDNSLNISDIQYLYDIESVEEKIDSETVVIIATTAKGRKDILEMVVNKQPLAVIAEKPLTQNIADYEKVMELCSEKKVPAYINFFAHMQPFYQEIYKEVRTSEEFTFYSNLPKCGLACNGIHQLELLTWLFNVKSYEIIESNLKSVYEQKRKGFYDMVGNIVLSTDEGNICVINNSEEDGISTHQIIAKKKVFNIYEKEQKMAVVDKKGDIKLKDIEYVHVSQYMDKVIENIVSSSGQNLLPDIKQGYLAHKILFEYMSLHNVENLNIT